MTSQKKPDGCAVMMRRTFLFILGLAAAKFLHQHFQVPLNRTNFWRFVEESKQKLITLFKEKTEKTAVNNPNLPDNPITPPASTPAPVTPKPIPAVETEPITVTPKPTPAVETKSAPVLTKKPRPVTFEKKSFDGIAFYQTTVNLRDPETFITIGLANGATQANSASQSSGDEDFAKLVQRNPGAVVINGTFFSKDAQKRVMGNMVAEGKFLKYSQWENYGTTLGIRENNQPEMITARRDGKPQWDQHWFSLTCGPRLLREGQIWLAPKMEGFSDPHVFDVGGRTAMGFNAQKDKLFLVTFLNIVSLEKEAKLMQGIGCHEAMNLDGGASKCLAHRGDILVDGGRPLTNVIVVYDALNPAPRTVKDSWLRFQKGDRPKFS